MHTPPTVGKEDVTKGLPSPWVKLGLANLMTLMALVYLGTKEAFIVTLLRVILGSILGGTFLGPTFFLSLVGRLDGIR